MIIVALVATLATSMLWQQWRSVQVEAAERARTQSALILTGALDWARLILREDGKTSSGIDHLGEPWAVPLAEARLSTFLAAGDTSADDAPDAFLSGAISDAQGRFNLAGLVSGGKVVVPEQQALGRLCEAVGVSAEVATRIATGMRDASPVPPPQPPSSAPGATPVDDLPPRAADPPLMPQSADQLTWFGVPAEAIRALEPFVVFLPSDFTTKVNVNTALREVLVAEAEGLDLATAERIVQARQRTPLKSDADIKALAPGITDASRARLGIKSDFFEVRGRLRLGDIVLEQKSLVYRDPANVVKVIRRERVSLRDSRS